MNINSAFENMFSCSKYSSKISVNFSIPPVTYSYEYKPLILTSL